MRRLILAVFVLASTLRLVVAAEPDEGGSVQPCPPFTVVNPSIEFDTKSGITDENISASFKFKMKNIGTKKLHPTAPLVYVSINGQDKTSKAMINQMDGGTAGQVSVSDLCGYNLPKGDYTVKLTVKLDDNSTVEGEAKVTFKKACEPCSPCPLSYRRPLNSPNVFCAMNNEAFFKT